MAGKFVLNQVGVAALLKDPKIQADLDRRADAIAQSAGVDTGFKSQSAGGKRARAVVIAVTPHAQRAEARDRRMTKAVDAGKGSTL